MLFDTLRAELRHWWTVRSTIRELDRLDDSELNDLGIGRWRIPEIARRSTP